MEGPHGHLSSWLSYGLGSYDPNGLARFHASMLVVRRYLVDDLLQLLGCHLDTFKAAENGICEVLGKVHTLQPLLNLLHRDGHADSFSRIFFIKRLTLSGLA
ncbi:Uncharacterised protein [uncultured archaeon]|nr:Uncharacterised protein [uncultured archaeon]